ncbi:WD40 repeat containing protein [Rhodotorula toruloides]|uniref:WD40 repeat containing protein n=1 Tax=Rhodotorula toruloides TaxID=5286 RepID=A0A511KQR9_RHOTO|nr:WD40 repeat containing protein [Rhodotorula toruloides]
MAKRKAPQAPSQAAVPAANPPAKKKARFSNPLPSAPPAHKAKAKTAAAPVQTPDATPDAPKRFVVSAGSYERLLYGLECEIEPSTTSSSGYSLSVHPVFSFPAHLSSLKTVAASHLITPGTGSERKVGGKYLVSAGTDEVIKVWDLQRRKEVGILEGDTKGTITCMRFVPQRNMLVVASSDSTIVLYRVRDFVLLRSLKGHKGRVNAIDAHPDGRVALSVGQDRMLRMWDLVAGKSVATMKLGTEGDTVRWNTDGTKFVVICNNQLTVYGLDMSIHHQLSAKSRFHDAQFCYFPLDKTDSAQREYLFVACEDGKVRVFDVANPTPVHVDETTDLSDLDLPKIEPVALLTGHANRVKMMDLLEVALPTSDSASSPSSTIVLTTISSDGKINLYDLARLPTPSSTPSDGKGKGNKATVPAPIEAKEIEPVASYDTDKTRLTCVCAIGLVERKKGADGKDVEESTDEEEAGDEEDGEETEEEELSADEEDVEAEFEGFEDEEEGEEE